MNAISDVEDEHQSQSTPLGSGDMPIWRIVCSLLTGTIVLLAIGTGICLHRGLAPSIFNMLNDNAIAGPFAVTAINMLQATHFIIALGIYYRGQDQEAKLSKIQLGLAVATHGALLLVLVLLPILGWSRDWASIVPVYVWAAWYVKCSLTQPEFC